MARSRPRKCRFLAVKRCTHDTSTTRPCPGDEGTAHDPRPAGRARPPRGSGATARDRRRALPAHGSACSRAPTRPGRRLRRRARGGRCAGPRRHRRPTPRCRSSGSAGRGRSGRASGWSTMAATPWRTDATAAPNSRAAASAASSRSIPRIGDDPLERAVDGAADPRARRQRRLDGPGASHDRRRSPRRERRDDDIRVAAPRRGGDGGGRVEEQLGLRLRRGRARSADAAPPGRAVRRQVGLGGAEDEAPLGARHRDVEPVQLFALARAHLLVERGTQRGRAAVLVVDEGAARRPLGLDRPLDQQRRRRRVGSLGLGVDHEHGVGLEPLRAVHGEQAHGRRAHRQCRLQRPLLQRPHERIRRRVATAVERERLREHGVDRVECERRCSGGTAAA